MKTEQLSQKAKKVYRALQKQRRAAVIANDLNALRKVYAQITKIFLAEGKRLFPSRSEAELLKDIITRDTIDEYKRDYVFRTSVEMAKFFGITERTACALVRLHGMHIEIIDEEIKVEERAAKRAFNKKKAELAESYVDVQQVVDEYDLKLHESLKDVEGAFIASTENRYFVTRTGEIRNARTGRLRKEVNKGGKHLFVCLRWSNDNEKTKKKAKWILEAFTGIDGEGMDFRFKDGDETNFHIDNLSWVSEEDICKRYALHEWKAIHGFERYEVSTDGKVFDLEKLRFVSISNEGTDRAPTVALHRDGEKRKRSLRKIVAEAFVEKPSPAHTFAQVKDRFGKTNIANVVWVKKEEYYNMSKKRIGSSAKTTKPKSIRVDGVFYPSITQAAKVVGVTKETLYKKFNEQPTFTYRGMHFERVGDAQ